MYRPVKKVNEESYQPQFVTQAFKVIKGQADPSAEQEQQIAAAWSNGLQTDIDLMTLVQLPATQLRRTVQFYVDVLELSQEYPERAIERNSFVQTMPRIGPGLHILETSEAEFRHLHGPVKGKQEEYIAFYAKSLAHLYDRLIRAGATIVQAPTEGYLSLKDPEGHLIGVYERTNPEINNRFESNITGFRHVQMNVSDPLRAAAFFDNALGMQKLPPSTEEEAIYMKVSSSEFNQPMIRLVQAAERANPLPMHWMLDSKPKHSLELHSKNIVALLERIQTHGGTVMEEVEFTGCGGYLKFYTPDGHYLWVNQDLRYGTSERTEPDNYRPQQVTTALKVIAGTIQSNQGGNEMEIVQSPIDNVVESAFIHVTDLRRSAEWYSMVMGVPVLEERLNGGNVYWLKLVGGTGIMLDDNRSNGPDVPRPRFMYTTKDIEASYHYLEERAVPLYPIERPHPGLAYFMFKDPDNNWLMVTESDYVDEVIQRLPDTDSPIKNRIGGVFLHVTEMNGAIRFHCKALGLSYRVVGDGPEDSIYELAMKSGSGVLLDDNRYRHGDDYEALFMFISPDVDAAKAYLESKGVPVFTDIERPGGELAFFTVKDPDGNVIMICSEME